MEQPGITAPRRGAGRKVLLVIAAVAVIAVVQGVRAYFRNRVIPLALESAQQVASMPEPMLDASLSPDGRVVAYVGSVSGTTRLFTKQVAGGSAPTALAPDIAPAHRWPRWSADGSHLLFSAGGDVYEVPVVGGMPRKVISASGVMNATATYSPDGKTITYADSEGLEQAPLGGGAPRLVLKGADVHSPEWSPNGRRIAYVTGNRAYVNAHGTTAPSGLWVVDVGNGVPVRVSESRHMNVGPVWFDDNLLLYVSNAEGTRDVYQLAITADGGAASEPARVTSGLDPYAISYARPTRRLAYTVLRAVWVANVKVP